MGLFDWLGVGSPNNAQFTVPQAASMDQIQGAYANEQQAMGQQQDMINALKMQAMGVGPNPAQAQYQQNVNQIAQQQAGMIGSQKGINPALAARMIAQQGGAAQQGAAANAATLQAQQQLAAQQQEANAVMGYNQLAQNQYGQLVGAMQGSESLNEKMAQQNAQNQTAVALGLINGVSGAVGKAATGGAGGGAGAASGGSIGSGVGGGIGMAKGGVVPAKNKAQFKMMPHHAAVHAIYHGGAMVPGKAEVSGDSLKNDKVPAVLSPKEIVLPRSVTMAPDAPEKAREFVANLLKQHGEKNAPEKGGKEHDDFKAALKKAIAGRKKK